MVVGPFPCRNLGLGMISFVLFPVMSLFVASTSTIACFQTTHGSCGEEEEYERAMYSISSSSRAKPPFFAWPNQETNGTVEMRKKTKSRLPIFVFKQVSNQISTFSKINCRLQLETRQKELFSPLTIPSMGRHFRPVLQRRPTTSCMLHRHRCLSSKRKVHH